MQAKIRYNPWADNTYTGMFKRAFKSKWFGSKKKEEDKGDGRAKRADDIHIEILQLSDNDKKEAICLAQGEGSWLSHLILDGEVKWRIEEDVP